MDTLKDYVLWYKDIPLSDERLSLEDNIVLSEISYLDLSEVYQQGQSETLRDYVHELKKIHLASIPDDSLISACAESKRFGSLIISDYEDRYDDSLPCQFSAMSIHLSDKVIYLAYRGTDDTIAGWKEDFMISYTRTKAQEYALDYAERMIDQSHFYYIGGHSKGANLALYAASLLPQEQFARIVRVFLNDGPGFCPEVLDTEKTARVSPIAVRIIPYYCIIGKLFEPDIPDVHIVRSAETGVNQHILSSWCFNHGKLDEVSSNSSRSIFMNQVIDEWIDQVDMEHRQSFVNTLFDSLSQNGSRTMSDLNRKGAVGFEAAVMSFAQSGNGSVKTAARIPLTALFGKSWMNAGTHIQKFFDSEMKKGIVILCAGIVCELIPNQFLNIIMMIVLALIVLFEAVITFSRLIKSRWNFRQERARVNLCIILTAAFVIILVKQQALFLLASLLFGIFFLLFAYNSAMNASMHKKQKGIHRRAVFETIVFTILGGYILVADDRDIAWYVIAMGAVFIIDGTIRIVQTILDHRGNH